MDARYVGDFTFADGHEMEVYFAGTGEETWPGYHETMTPRVKYQRHGRNLPCPCGSGKKFKRCCEGVLVCTECEGDLIIRQGVNQTFLYGEQELTAKNVQVYSCANCGEWTGEDAEEARDRAIAEYKESKR